MGKSLYVQAGCYGEHLGVLHVFIDPKTGEFADATHELITSKDSQFKPDPTLLATFQAEDDKIKARLAKVSRIRREGAAEGISRRRFPGPDVWCRDSLYPAVL